MFPNQTKSIPAIIVWSIILIADIAVGAVVAMKLELPAAGRNSPALLVAILVAGGLLFVENFIYTKISNLFR